MKFFTLSISVCSLSFIIVKSSFDLFSVSYYFDSTFIILMKDFISKSDNIKEMFDIIFLLLLGNDDSVDIACLLVGLLKEKK